MRRAPLARRTALARKTAPKEIDPRYPHPAGSNRKPLCLVSVKQVKRDRELAGTKKRLIEDRGPYCQARFFEIPGCLGMTTRLHLHHVVPRSGTRDDSDRNCVLICDPCHRFVHLNPDKAREYGLIRSPLPLSHVQIVESEAS